MTEAIRKQLAAHGAKMPPTPPSPPREQRSAPQATPVPAAAVASVVAQEIVFTGVVPGLNGGGGLLRSHWARKRKLLAGYEWVVQAAGLQPMSGPVRLELVRHSIGRPMDFDNLVSTGKLLTDALVRCGVLPDDNPAVIAERHYSQQPAAGKGYQCTVIRLTPLASIT